MGPCGALISACSANRGMVVPYPLFLIVIAVMRRIPLPQRRFEQVVC